MRNELAFLAAVLVASTAHAAPLAPPPFAVPGPNSPAAPTAIAVISCEVEDLTGTRTPPGDPGSVVMPARDWRDLELKVVNGELQCKRQLVEIQDKDEVVNGSVQLHHNFGDPAQCAAGAALFFTTSHWDDQHRNWAVVAVGCPTAITDQAGKIVGWHMPECPTHIGSIDGIKCKFDESQT